MEVVRDMFGRRLGSFVGEVRGGAWDMSGRRPREVCGVLFITLRSLSSLLSTFYFLDLSFFFCLCFFVFP